MMQSMHFLKTCGKALIVLIIVAYLANTDESFSEPSTSVLQETSKEAGLQSNEGTSVPPLSDGRTGKAKKTIKSYPLAHARGTEVLKQLKSLLKNSRDFLCEINSETNSIVVMAEEDTMKLVDQLVTELDVCPLQVHIKALIIEVTLSEEAQIGIEWSAIFNFINSSEKYALKFANDVSAWATGRPADGMYTFLSGENLELFLSYLEKNYTFNILASPHLNVLNNEDAKIIIGQKIPFPRSVDEVGSALRTSYEYQDVGLILKVTPLVTREGEIRLKVFEEISKPTGESVLLAAPLIQQRTAESVLVTAHGKTVLMGGIMQNNRISENQKIPVLGHIPILGKLFFSYSTTRNEKTELLILLTPYLIKDVNEIMEQGKKYEQRLEQLKEKMK